MMKWRKIAFLLSCVLVMSLCLTAAGAGTQTDPVISLSYLNGLIREDLSTAVLARVRQMIADPAELETQGEENAASISRDGACESVARRVLENLQMKSTFLYETNGRSLISLKKDDVVSGLAGTTLLMRSGTAAVINRPIINLARGNQAAAGSAVAQNTNYMLPANDYSGVRITSDSAKLLIDGAYRIVSLRYRAQYFDLADALKTMNLFRGSNIGYELSRGATRVEAVVMLLRLLGEEEAAKAYTGAHPFDDVDAWATRYVAYAYAKGYARGVSNTHFGSKDQTTANHYMTFLLRALGYNDKAGDFSWNSAMKSAQSFGMLSENERSAVEKAGFHRDQMVFLSYYTLFAKKKGSDTELLSDLIGSGSVSKTAAESAISSVTRPRL